MRSTRSKRLGPLSYSHIKGRDKNFISVWLTAYGNAPYGWEWGTDNTLDNPSFCLRIAHFNVFSYQSFEKANPTVWLLGFWWSM